MKHYTAKTLDDLLNNVAQERSVSRDDLSYFILEEKPGFLGFGASVTAEVYAIHDVSVYAQSYIETFLKGFEIEATVSVEQNNNNLRIAIDADNNAILIGRGGKSLDGLGQLVRSAVNAKFKRRFYVNLDINNYKSDRYQKLKAMAHRIAKQVQRSRVNASLDPMPNDERRIIHKELTNFPNIRTESDGSGRNRHLVIVYDATKE